MPISLLQHSYCTLVITLFGPFSRLFINLTVCSRAIFPETGNHSCLARPSRHSTTGTPTPGTSGSRCFSLILLHERIRRRIRLCHFSTLIDIVAETAIVSSGTLPVGLPLPTSKNSLYTLFCPLILEHCVSLIISNSGAKILIQYVLLILLFTIVFNL